MSAWRNCNPCIRALGPCLLIGGLALLAWLLPPIPQPPAYHDFADRRACLGLPNCLDTASNALFVLAGAGGLRFLFSQSGKRAFIDRRQAWPYALFFFAVILTGFASGYYHLAPDNAGLMWDRAAIALAFMAWFAAILCERVSLRAGLMLLPLLLALLFDLTDRPVFGLSGGLISGHTLKHTVAALAAVWVMRYLQRRRAL